MLVAGFFRLPNDLPKAVWRYPMSYIGFHGYALQVSQTSPSTIDLLVIIDFKFFDLVFCRQQVWRGGIPPGVNCDGILFGVF
jgi:hypothetical protein